MELVFVRPLNIVRLEVWNKILVWGGGDWTTNVSQLFSSEFLPSISRSLTGPELQQPITSAGW